MRGGNITRRVPGLLFDHCRCRTQPFCLTCRRWLRYRVAVQQRMSQHLQAGANGGAR